MAINILNEKDMKVKLIGVTPRESFVDIAATFTRSEGTLEDIIQMPYNAKLVKNVVNMGHLACTEFDYFIFAVEGLSRVTEVQLVRKRLASYLLKSGRVEKGGKRNLDVVIPDTIKDHKANVSVHGYQLTLDHKDILNIINTYYNQGIDKGLPEEDLRYLKPQGTEFKGLIAMNAHALLDWFKIRCCKNAQHEIRGLAQQMLKLAKEHSPELFENAGPSCVSLGYCPEGKFQHKDCKGKVLTKEQALKILKEYKDNNSIK